MNEVQTPAEETRAGDEVVGAEDTKAPEIEDSEGSQAAEEAAPQPEEGDKADEAESRSKKRREERRKAMEQARAEAESKAAELRRVTDELERIRKAGEGKKPPQVTDFENYDDYIAARAVYAARQANDEDRQEGVTAQKTAAEREAETARNRAAEEARRNFSESVIEAREKYADFEQVVFDDNPNTRPPISDGLAQMILFSESPADLAYAVAKDRAMAGKLSSLVATNPIEAAREIGRIEARLSTPKPRTETKAPDPITPVRGKGGAAIRNPEKMSVAEWRAAREAGWKPS